MRLRIPYIDAVALGGNAIASGATRISPFTSVWDLSNSCHEPVHVTVWARPNCRDRHMQMDKGTFPVEVTLNVRCRKCAACRKARGALWAFRAHKEICGADRSWFVTLTVRDNQTSFHDKRMNMQKAIYIAQSKMIGTELLDLPNEEILLALHNVIQPEVTKYLKRVRERVRATYGAPIVLRYLLVMEPHQERGTHLPHYHMLIHSYDVGRPLLKEHLHNGEKFTEPNWKIGFWHGRIIDDDRKKLAAWYISKYLNKYAASRVRASLAYGLE